MRTILIPVIVPLLLAGCFESPISIGIDIDDILNAREDIYTFGMRNAIWNRIIKGDTIQTSSPNCGFFMFRQHYKKYSLEEVMVGVRAFRADNVVPPIIPFIVCWNYAVDCWGDIIHSIEYMGCPVGVIAYRNRVTGVQHAELLFWDGTELWLIDPITGKVTQFDKTLLEAYGIIF